MPGLLRADAKPTSYLREKVWTRNTTCLGFKTNSDEVLRLGSLRSGLLRTMTAKHDVVTWDANIDYFAVRHTDGRLCVSWAPGPDLQNRFTNEDVLPLHVRQQYSGTDGIWVLKNGDILAKIFSRSHPCESILCRFDKAGTETWRFKCHRLDFGVFDRNDLLDGRLGSSVAIGNRNRFYNIEEPRTADAQGNRRAWIVARQISNGHPMHWTSIILDHDPRNVPCILHIVGDEEFLLVKFANERILSLGLPGLATIRRTGDQSNPSNGPGSFKQVQCYPSQESGRFIEQILLDDDVSFLYLNSFDSQSNTLRRQAIITRYGSRRNRDRGDAEPAFIDPDRNVFVHFNDANEDRRSGVIIGEPTARRFRIVNFTLAERKSRGSSQLVLNGLSSKLVKKPRSFAPNGERAGWDELEVYPMDNPDHYLTIKAGHLIHWLPPQQRRPDRPRRGRLLIFGFRPHW